MCTVTYLPVNQGFVLASNRDEALGRAPAAFPVHWHNVPNGPALFPQDTEAGGTWLVARPRRVVCLLNGAFVRHHRTPPYRLSRGIVVLDTLQYADIQTFAEGYDLNGIEPFTLVWAELPAETPILTELRWDGHTLHSQVMDNTQPHLWASATLYLPEDQAIKQQWLTHWLHTTPPAQRPDALHAFQFQHRMQNPEYDVATRYGNVSQTLSISRIHCHPDGLVFHYHDLVSGQEAVSK